MSSRTRARSSRSPAASTSSSAPFSAGGAAWDRAFKPERDELLARGRRAALVAAELRGQLRIALHQRGDVVVVELRAAGAAGEIGVVQREVVAGSARVGVAGDVVGVLPVAVLRVLDEGRQLVRVRSRFLVGIRAEEDHVPAEVTEAVGRA